MEIQGLNLQVTFIKKSVFTVPSYQLEISKNITHSPTKDVVFEMNEKDTLVNGKGNRKYSVLHPPSIGADMDQPNFGNQWIYNLLHMDLASILSKELTAREEGNKASQLL